MVSFGDGTIFTYGDQELCTEKFANAIYQTKELENPLLFSHLYKSPTRYTVFAIAADASTTLKTDLDVLAATIPCDKTSVTISGGVDTPFLAPKIERARKIFLEGAAEIVCNVSVTTLKSWRVSKVKVAEVLEIERDISLKSLSTYTMPQLATPPRFFEYGMYCFVYELKVIVGTTELVKTAKAFIEVNNQLQFELYMNLKL
ncbi:uncharacterized protein LOC143029933 [Oratosquilla oratoria]|uniref:uncharacterized protein LOC143029933 n=1 Tax=Oratosquilla oratoria TaxID=337810 RepID=UPI003F7661F9